MLTNTHTQDLISILKVSVMSFGKTLKGWRKSVGMTQEELALGVGVNVSYISNLERDFSANTRSGKPRPSEELCERLARVLKRRVDDVRIAAGWSPKNLTTRPQNFAEFIDVLTSLGIEHFENFEGARHLSPDEYEQLLLTIRAVIDATVRRPRIIDIDISDDEQGENHIRKVR